MFKPSENCICRLRDRLLGCRCKRPQRPLHICGCGSHRWAWDTRGRQWFCRECFSNPCATCVKRKVTGACTHASYPSQASADEATLRRYYLTSESPVAVNLFEAWVARVLAGETVADILDKARGTIEADVLDEDLRSLYVAQRRIGCTDEEWERRMGRSRFPSQAGLDRARAKRCDHDWHEYVLGDGRRHRACALCGMEGYDLPAILEQLGTLEERAAVALRERELDRRIGLLDLTDRRMDI